MMARPASSECAKPARASASIRLVLPEPGPPVMTKKRCESSIREASVSDLVFLVLDFWIFGTWLFAIGPLDPFAVERVISVERIFMPAAAGCLPGRHRPGGLGHDLTHDHAIPNAAGRLLRRIGARTDTVVDAHRASLPRLGRPVRQGGSTARRRRLSRRGAARVPSLAAHRPRRQRI